MVHTSKDNSTRTASSEQVGDLSKNKEVDIPLDDFNVDTRMTNSSDSHTRGNEEWLLLEASNPFRRFMWRVWNGPEEPLDERPQFSSPILTYLDNLPEESFKSRFSKRSIQILLLVVYCAVWFGVVSSFIHPYLIRTPFFYSSDDKIPIIPLRCNSYMNWGGTNNACGVNAQKCGPFEEKEYFIRCPALCDREGWTYAGIAVGDKRVKYTGYEIGGGSRNDDEDLNALSYPYRADSFPCAAALHAGVISPVLGGCARMSMDGPQVSFPKVKGKLGQWSVEFDSFFPGSYSFRAIRDGITSGCYDPRILVIVLNIAIGLPILYLSSGIVGYWIISLVGYWTVALALDPPILSDPHDPESVYELISIAFQRLLPLCFILYVIWKCAAKRTMEKGSPLLKVLLWYPTIWLGIMNNVTFDRLPVDRLTVKDLKEQAGALTAVGSIAATILVCAIIQAYALWKSGRFQKYFQIYISIIVGLILLASIPGLTLRIHHYILGLILIPGCATRGFSAYLFQGILLGLFISGVSRWDFASIVETDFSLLRGEAGVAMRPPQFYFNEAFNHTVSWQMNPEFTDLDPTGNVDGFSLLINDFEAYVGRNESVDIDVLISENQELSSMINKSLSDSKNTVKLYLRVAQASTRAPDSNRGDYTNAGTLEWPQGIWHDPIPGVS